MTDELKVQIQQRIAQLEAELSAFVEQANREIVARQGGIMALRQLMNEMIETGHESAPES